jgi:hypothetical protein
MRKCHRWWETQLAPQNDDFELSWDERLIWLDTLDPNETFTLDHFVSFGLPHLKERPQNLRRRKQPTKLAVHIENPGCHNGQKVVDKMRRNHMIRFEHPLYLPGLSP